MTGSLTAEYGPEISTVYSNSRLNRLSWFRDNVEFLNKAFKDKSARFILLNKLKPLVVDTERNDRPAHDFVYASLADVKDIVGEPYIPVDQRLAAWKPQDGGKDSVSQLVFLGIDEAEPSDFSYEGFSGVPYFAIDVTSRPRTVKDEAAKREKLVEKLVTDKADFKDPKFGVRLPRPDFAVYAEARQVLDWNLRNMFCAGCGQPTISVDGGFKRVCPPHDDYPCETRGVISNLSFPRTDCSIIVAVLNYKGDKVLIGRSRRFPKGMYSCLAGFLEPGESIEDCVRREVFEEAGVKIGRVVLHSSQPWPYPANIMLGCLAEVADDSDESQRIHLGHDKELEDAKWVTIAELRKAVKNASGRSNGDDAPSFFVPPPAAIAWTLLDACTKRHEKL